MCGKINIYVLKMQRIFNRLKIRDEKGKKLNEDGLISESYNFAIREFQRITMVEEMEILSATELIISKPLIKLGDCSFVIKYLQWFLKININGKVDSKTQAEIFKFQSKKLIATDGIVGKETWGKIIG